MFKKLLPLFLIASIFCIYYYVYIITIKAPFKSVFSNRSHAVSDITPSTKADSGQKKKRLVNIALFAVDRRTKAQTGNADVIIIISINQTNGEIRLASILRDTFVKIDGYGMAKINAAYAVGGPQLAVKTINQNFEMDIKDYISVDFYEFARIIDVVGGINIQIEPEEIISLNKYLDEVAKYDKIPAAYVKAAGWQNLTGRQVVAYSRIRDIGKGDYDRTERQRNVLVGLLKKMKASERKLIPLFFTEIFPNMETSMSNLSILNFAVYIFNTRNQTIKKARFPLNSQGHGKKINNIWYLIADRKAVTKSLAAFLNDQ